MRHFFLYVLMLSLLKNIQADFPVEICSDLGQLAVPSLVRMEHIFTNGFCAPKGTYQYDSTDCGGKPPAKCTSKCTWIPKSINVGEFSSIPVYPSIPPYSRFNYVHPRNKWGHMKTIRRWWNYEGCNMMLNDFNSCRDGACTKNGATYLKDSTHRSISKIGIAFAYGSGVDKSIGIPYGIGSVDVNVNVGNAITAGFFAYRTHKCTESNCPNEWKCGHEVILEMNTEMGLGGSIGLGGGPITLSKSWSFAFSVYAGILTKKYDEEAGLDASNASLYGSGGWMGSAYGSVSGTIAEVETSIATTTVGGHVFAGQAFSYPMGYTGNIHHVLADVSTTDENAKDGCQGARRYYHADCWDGFTMVNPVTTVLSPAANSASETLFGEPLYKEFTCGTGYGGSVDVDASIGFGAAGALVNGYWDGWAWELYNLQMVDVKIMVENKTEYIIDKIKWQTIEHKQLFERLHWKDCKHTWECADGICTNKYTKQSKVGKYEQEHPVGPFGKCVSPIVSLQGCNTYNNIDATNKVSNELPSGCVSDGNEVIFNSANTNVECSDNCICGIRCENDDDDFDSSGFLETGDIDNMVVDTVDPKLFCRYRDPFSTNSFKQPTLPYDSSKFGSCNDCAEGKYQHPGQPLLCMDCPIGKYQNVKNQTTCITCPQGYFQILAGQTACNNVPANWVTVDTAGTYTNNQFEIFTIVPLPKNIVNTRRYGIEGQCKPGETWNNDTKACQQCNGHIITRFESQTWPFTSTDASITGAPFYHDTYFNISEWLKTTTKSIMAIDKDELKTRLLYLHRKSNLGSKLLAHYGVYDDGWLGLKLKTGCISCAPGWYYNTVECVKKFTDGKTTGIIVSKNKWEPRWVNVSEFGSPETVFIGNRMVIPSQYDNAKSKNKSYAGYFHNDWLPNGDFILEYRVLPNGDVQRCAGASEFKELEKEARLTTEQYFTQISISPHLKADGLYPSKFVNIDQIDQNQREIIRGMGLSNKLYTKDDYKTAYCLECQPGYYMEPTTLDNLNKKCVKCPIGKYNYDFGQTYCRECIGSFGDATNSYNDSQYDNRLSPFEFKNSEFQDYTAYGNDTMQSRLSDEYKTNSYMHIFNRQLLDQGYVGHCHTCDIGYQMVRRSTLTNWDGETDYVKTTANIPRYVYLTKGSCLDLPLGGYITSTSECKTAIERLSDAGANVQTGTVTEIIPDSTHRMADYPPYCVVEKINLTPDRTYAKRWLHQRYMINHAGDNEITTPAISASPTGHKRCHENRMCICTYVPNATVIYDFEKAPVSPAVLSIDPKFGSAPYFTDEYTGRAMIDTNRPDNKRILDRITASDRAYFNPYESYSGLLSDNRQWVISPYYNAHGAHYANFTQISMWSDQQVTNGVNGNKTWWDGAGINISLALEHDKNSPFFQKTNQFIQGQCIHCPAGWYVNAAVHISTAAQETRLVQNCTMCPVGTSFNHSENDWFDQWRCVDCQPGKYNNDTAQATCKDCPVGFYQPLSQQTECLPCDEQFYQDDKGRTYCKQCAAGEYRNYNISGTNDATSCQKCTGNLARFKSTYDPVAIGTELWHDVTIGTVNVTIGTVIEIQSGWWKIELSGSTSNNIKAAVIQDSVISFQNWEIMSDTYKVGVHSYSSQFFDLESNGCAKACNIQAKTSTQSYANTSTQSYAVPFSIDSLVESGKTIESWIPSYVASNFDGMTRTNAVYTHQHDEDAVVMRIDENNRFERGQCMCAQSHRAAHFGYISDPNTTKAIQYTKPYVVCNKCMPGFYMSEPNIKVERNVKPDLFHDLGDINIDIDDFSKDSVMCNNQCNKTNPVWNPIARDCEACAGSEQKPRYEFTWEKYALGFDSVVFNSADTATLDSDVTVQNTCTIRVDASDGNWFFYSSKFFQSKIFQHNDYKYPKFASKYIKLPISERLLGAKLEIDWGTAPSKSQEHFDACPGLDCEHLGDTCTDSQTNHTTNYTCCSKGISEDTEHCDDGTCWHKDSKLNEAGKCYDWRNRTDFSHVQNVVSKKYTISTIRNDGDYQYIELNNCTNEYEDYKPLGYWNDPNEEGYNITVDKWTVVHSNPIRMFRLEIARDLTWECSREVNATSFGVSENITEIDHDGTLNIINIRSEYEQDVIDVYSNRTKGKTILNASDGRWDVSAETLRKAIDADVRFEGDLYVTGEQQLGEFTSFNTGASSVHLNGTDIGSITPAQWETYVENVMYNIYIDRPTYEKPCDYPFSGVEFEEAAATVPSGWQKTIDCGNYYLWSELNETRTDDKWKLHKPADGEARNDLDIDRQFWPVQYECKNGWMYVTILGDNPQRVSSTDVCKGAEKKCEILKEHIIDFDETRQTQKTRQTQNSVLVSPKNHVLLPYGRKQKYNCSQNYVAAWGNKYNNESSIEIECGTSGKEITTRQPSYGIAQCVLDPTKPSYYIPIKLNDEYAKNPSEGHNLCSDLKNTGNQTSYRYYCVKRNDKHYLRRNTNLDLKVDDDNVIVDQSCPAGQFWSTSWDISCTKCLPGKFKANAGAEACTQCPTGTTSSAGAAECTVAQCQAGTRLVDGNCEQCAAGYYQDSLDQSECKTCPSGFSSMANFTKCIPPKMYEELSVGRCEYPLTINDCATYTNFVGSKLNSSLPGGCYRDNDNVWFNDDQNADKYNVDSNYPTICERKCQPGFIYDNKSCVQCAEGKKSTSVMSYECLTCAPGKTSSTNKTACEQCSQGKYNNGNSGICSACPVGTYQNETGSLTCIPCPVGLIAVSAGSSNCVKCQMPKVFNLTSKQCEDCPVGKYRLTPSQYECLDITTIRFDARDYEICNDKALVDWEGGQHSIHEVSKAEYIACNNLNGVERAPVQTGGSKVLALGAAPGVTRYFICAEHCSAGRKFSTSCVPKTFGVVIAQDSDEHCVKQCAKWKNHLVNGFDDESVDLELLGTNCDEMDANVQPLRSTNCGARRRLRHT